MQISRLYEGTPCDEDGYDLPEGALPPPTPAPLGQDDEMLAFPFSGVEEFELADLIFNKIQMSTTEIDSLMDVWARFNQRDHGGENDVGLDPPFSGMKDLYNTIDSIPLGDIPWQAFTVQHTEEHVNRNNPSWMTQTYEVWFRDPLSIMEAQIVNPDLARDMDFAPKRVKGKDGQCQYCDFMLGNWAWDQADIIAADLKTHGSMFAPVILGSDKTTVSVATGQNEYYPLVTDKQYEKSAAFRKFHRQLFHASLAYILQSLKPWMMTPKITRCGNSHFYCVIYGLGPYIADYPEQCLLACIVYGWCAQCMAYFNDLDNQEKATQCSYEHTEALYDAVGGNLRALWDGYGIIADIIPFTSGFPYADIHDLIAPDLLHQIIKGTFKDHLVDWVIKYINITHEEKEAERIIGEIDCRIAVVPQFPGLRHFLTGRGFKQWTGDDLKALMKVFLPAITGLVPDKMVQAIASFLEICYLIWHSQINEATLMEIDHAVFIETDVRPDGISLPRQHSLVYYHWLIQQFGAPNGLCSSIMESKHIKAMLLTNERLDKLSAFHVDLQSCGIWSSAIAPFLPDIDMDNDLDAWVIYSDSDVRLPERPITGYPKSLDSLSAHINIPHLRENICRFLYDQLNPEAVVMGMEVDLNLCPIVSPLLTVDIFHSAVCLFHAPSDLSGINGMHRELIYATPVWRNSGVACHDCVFVANNTGYTGFCGLDAAQVHLFFSFTYNDVRYPCAFVHWFQTYGNSPCENTGLWMVEPHFDALQRCLTSVIHIDTILCGAHLIPVYGPSFIPYNLTFSDTLHAFALYYVNKYTDHHSHEIAF
ncbi:hypothetical protein BDQ17DRAFT_1389069 [Cyathus striatus]|nr:hypothetical protein BDQ17DRAFT_1389069 [Cyathus striatus]